MKTSKDNRDIECLKCGLMVPKWILKQHMKAGHPTRAQLPAPYQQYHTQMKQVSEAQRKEIIASGFIPLIKPPELMVLDSIGVGIEGSTYTWIVYRTDGPAGRDPLARDGDARQTINDMVTIPRIDTGSHIWVPEWVEGAVKMYRSSQEYAGLSLSEFLSKVADSTSV